MLVLSDKVCPQKPLHVSSYDVCISVMSSMLLNFEKHLRRGSMVKFSQRFFFCAWNRSVSVLTDIWKGESSEGILEEEDLDSCINDKPLLWLNLPAYTPAWSVYFWRVLHSVDCTSTGYSRRWHGQMFYCCWTSNVAQVLFTGFVCCPRPCSHFISSTSVNMISFWR